MHLRGKIPRAGDPAALTIFRKFRLEFRVARSRAEIQAKLREGLEQVEERRYSLTLPEGERILAAMVCPAEDRCFAAWKDAGTA